ncbi:hypothetical protein C8R44DRAFT_813576 [Mycena epipterygia]|nr:hypothetical protein C8R44DRAFT_813576 [Mycena epipterygia]
MTKETPPMLLNGGPAGAGLPQYSYQPVSYQTILISGRVEQQPVYRRSPLQRFIVAFLLAVGIWAILRTLVAHHGHRWNRGHHWNIPSSMVLDRCVSGSDWALSDMATMSSHSAEASFEIPLSPDTVLLLSRHSTSSFFSHSSSFSGSLDITTSPHLNNTAKVVVSSFYGKDQSDNVKACLVTGKDGETGVGIFTRHSLTGFGWDATFMKVRLMLPETTTPLHLKGLITDLPNFSLNVGNLEDAVKFNSVSFKASNAAMHVESLSANDATLHTSNGAISANSLISTTLTLRTSNAPISGTFNTTDSLHLTTSNAAITVTVGLESRNKTPTTLHMKTSNNRINAQVDLIARKNRGGAFGVVGTTSNGVLTIKVSGAPRDAALDLTARTSNAAAEVRLPLAYEGAFGITTSNNRSAVTRLDESGDKREVEYERNDGRTVKGHVYSEEANKERGQVTLTTSNAPAVLFI